MRDDVAKEGDLSITFEVGVREWSQTIFVTT